MSELSEEQFRDLMRRAKDGCEDAIRALAERYGTVLLHAVRRKLRPELRRQFDSTDFVQEVWASFFRRALDQHDFDRPEQLVAFLVSVARNKVAEANRQRLERQKYDLRRERRLGSLSAGAEVEPAAQQPTPEEGATARDEWRRWLSALPEECRPVLRLIREGYTHREIAARLCVRERTVGRILTHLARQAPPQFN